MAVAMKDLEIRGAGNLLGGEQSGHIAGVGFDLYVRLVGEAVAAFQQAAGARASDEEEPRRGQGRPAGRRAPPARLRRRASGCGWRPTARSPRRPTRRRSTRSSRSSPTATASRRRRCTTCSPSPRSGSGAGRRASPRSRCGRQRPDRPGGAARLRAAAAAPAAPEGAVQGGGEAGHGAARRSKAAGSAARRCATWRCSTGAPL